MYRRERDGSIVVPLRKCVAEGALECERRLGNHGAERRCVVPPPVLDARQVVKLDLVRAAVPTEAVGGWRARTAPQDRVPAHLVRVLGAKRCTDVSGVRRDQQGAYRARRAR